MVCDTQGYIRELRHVELAGDVGSAAIRAENIEIRKALPLGGSKESEGEGNCRYDKTGDNCHGQNPVESSGMAPTTRIKFQLQ